MHVCVSFTHLLRSKPKIELVHICTFTQVNKISGNFMSCHCAWTKANKWYQWSRWLYSNWFNEKLYLQKIPFTYYSTVKLINLPKHYRVGITVHRRRIYKQSSEVYNLIENTKYHTRIFKLCTFFIKTLHIYVHQRMFWCRGRKEFSFSLINFTKVNNSFSSERELSGTRKMTGFNCHKFWHENWKREELDI